MADGNALIAALRSATPSGMVKAPGAPTTFEEAPWTNVSRQPLSVRCSQLVYALATLVPFTYT